MRSLGVTLAASLLIAASGPVQPEGEPLDVTAARAQAEARAAEIEAARLQKAADSARDEAQRLRAEQAAAARQIEAAEARISAADANLRLVSALVAARRERLTREQAPAASLLAALAVMSERPPLLTILDEGSTEEFVRVRLLLDSTLPAIRARTAALRTDLDEGRKLQLSAAASRKDLVDSRNTLAVRKREFAELEEQALELAARRGGEALGAGDVALARGEDVQQIQSEAERRRSAAGVASELARMPAPPARPGSESQYPPAAPLDYRLPANAPVLEGLGTVAPNGVRSRGLILSTRHGARIVVPASGTIRFSGPFRSYDSVVIIEHRDGWMSLLLDVASEKRPGEKVTAGEPLGRALGRIGVELSRNGQHISPALIAGSSLGLSKGRKEG
jgi:septal ring factor EnvC (AmiA/AmiB activator)